jgi:beta-galactosidase GanA
VPSLWPDILEKVKAAGLNGVSVYTHMGLINPAPGVVDFGGFRALQPLYDAAKAAGIWIVLRPGNHSLLLNMRKPVANLLSRTCQSNMSLYQLYFY